jgi:hypothetical protein
MSAEVAVKLLALIREGATVLVGGAPQQSAGLADTAAGNKTVRRVAAQIWGEECFTRLSNDELGTVCVKPLGRGRVVKLPYEAQTFEQLGLERDAIISENGDIARQVAWAHRASDSTDLYFIANQRDEVRDLDLALRATGRAPELWDAVTGSITTATTWERRDNHTLLRLRLPESGSVFVVFRQKTSAEAAQHPPHPFSPAFDPTPLLVLEGRWQVAFSFPQGKDTLTLATPESWSAHPKPAIRHYSGTAQYRQTFTWAAPYALPAQLWLDLGRVANLAEVTLNGQPCGVAWAKPYRVDITRALREGSNELVVEVSNTWANRLIGDYALPEAQRSTWTTAPPALLNDLPLQEAGLLGEVKIVGSLQLEPEPI